MPMDGRGTPRGRDHAQGSARRTVDTGARRPDQGYAASPWARRLGNFAPSSLPLDAPLSPPLDAPLSLPSP